LAAGERGGALAIAFNVRYVLEGLKAMAAERVEAGLQCPTTQRFSCRWRIPATPIW